MSEDLPDEATRREILNAHGVNLASIEALLAYNAPRFPHRLIEQPVFPLNDELFVAPWRDYASTAEKQGLLTTLREKLPQFNFPVEAGISKTTAYIDATRRGKPHVRNDSLNLEAPDDLELIINPTLVGHIPVLVAGTRSDFVTLVQALSARNEPIDVPDSMGASTVMGFNNWDRVNNHKSEWQQQNPDKSWQKYFPEFAKRGELFQDKFIILSRGAYSDVQGERFGYTESQWQELSLSIRLEHECAHYFMLRVFGSMANNLFDEIMADYAGIRLTTGSSYRADWFLAFMGLEDYPHYREGGRLQNYTDSLSGDATRVLHSLVVAAANCIEEFSEGYQSSDTLADELLVLCGLTLEQLAADDSAAALRQILDSRLAGNT
jgi:hypothetical protein